ncbi:MAG: hypothetical protein WCK58_18010, partial [Chloroflexota bacterium]
VNPEPTLVAPVKIVADAHPVQAAALEATVTGRQVSVKLAWWSGVEPCNVLAGIAIDRSGTAITLTVNEGAAQMGVMCIEIAIYKATIIDLGELDPGTYTISATGLTAPVEVTIAG